MNILRKIAKAMINLLNKQTGERTRSGRCCVCGSDIIECKKEKKKEPWGTEQVYEERCAECGNLLFGWSKNIKSLRDEKKQKKIATVI